MSTEWKSARLRKSRMRLRERQPTRSTKSWVAKGRCGRQSHLIMCCDVQKAWIRKSNIYGKIQCGEAWFQTGRTIPGYGPSNVLSMEQRSFAPPDSRGRLSLHEPC